MKILKEFCENNNLTLHIITYKSQGFRVKRKGYDIRKDGFAVLSLEPVSYSNGNKWFLRDSPENYKGPYHIKRVSKSFLKSIPL